MSIMSRQNSSKINRLLRNWPVGTVAVSSWLAQQGIDRKLVYVYNQSGWIEQIGHGAYRRAGDTVDWTGAVFALQNSLNLPIHVGGTTALGLKGYAHYIPMGEGYPVTLFGFPGIKLPTWFREYDWKVTIHYTTPRLFKEEGNKGFTEYDFRSYSIQISSPERAILEVLHSVHSKHSFVSAKELFEGLTTLRPTLITQLLEVCTSIKTKRLFMVLAEMIKYPWLQEINLSNVDFGRGNRMLVKGGHLHKKYAITIPAEEFNEHDR